MADPVSVRFSDVEREALQRAAQVEGRAMSAVVREAVRVFLKMERGDERLEDLERRITRLEQMAGL